MSYLEEIQTQIKVRNINKLLQLWEEYCSDDKVDALEFIQILKSIKRSDFSKIIGKNVEKALPLWKQIEDKNLSYQVIKYLLDIQVTNSALLADIALEAALERYNSYGKDKVNEWIRFVGLSQRQNFQGALSSLELLTHIKQGHFVYHSGGWGVGEIMEVSPIRQQATIEFEKVLGQKYITFTNAFNVLEPMDENHFLVRRFAFADQLESEAIEDPVKVIKDLLNDLGPKSAGEIKEALYEAVIPADQWNRWWQNARAKLKKDPFIEAPASLRDAFRLRSSAITTEEHLKKAKAHQSDPVTTLRSVYNMMRDLTEGEEGEVIKLSLLKSMQELLEKELTEAQKLEAALLLEAAFNTTASVSSSEIIEKSDKNELVEMIGALDIIALKKRACIAVKNSRSDWPDLFLTLLVSTQQGMLRDYLLKELNQGETRKILEDKLLEVLESPTQYPELVVWYFQKVVAKKGSDLPFSDKEGQCRFFEAFLILFSYLEQELNAKELIKRMYLLLSGNRYAVVREVIEGTSIEFIKEFLLLVAKCQTLTDHDLKILRSLSEVIHPSLARKKLRKESHLDGHILWATEKGLHKIQEQAQHIATIEMVLTAREIEAARELGDLRENSEYKFALEKRSRQQTELKRISDQIKRSRVITELDVSREEVDIGSIVDLEDQNGKLYTYTILGPLEADPDKGILSFQSKLAQTMLGLREGETFSFRTEEYKIVALRVVFDKD